MARSRLRLFVIAPLLSGLLLLLSKPWTAIDGSSVQSQPHPKDKWQVTAFALPPRRAPADLRSRRLSGLQRDVEAENNEEETSTAQAVAVPARASGAAQRRILLLGGLSIAGKVVQPTLARADVPLNMRTTVKLYSEGLQSAADQLVFGIRPRLEKEDWPWLQQYLRGDSYGNSKGYVDLAFALDRVVVGNEDFLEGVDNANYKMVGLLEVANQTVWADSPRRKETLLQTWDDMAALLGGVMAAVNNYVAAEPELKGMSSYIPFALPNKDVSKYGRSDAQFKSKCTGIVQSGMCIAVPEGTQENIAKYAQVGMQLNPFIAPTCKDGKCGG